MPSPTPFQEPFRAAVEDGTIVGVVLAATNKSGTLNYAEAFGKTGASPDADALTVEATFWIASCTKLVTTIATLQCIERGLFALDAPDDIARLLPEYASPELLRGFDEDGQPTTKPAENRITMRQLLTHTSGLAGEFGNPELSAWRAGRKRKGHASETDVVERLQSPLVFEPGEGWDYSTLGMDWVGQIIERANGNVSLERYVQDNICGPLGMHDTTFHLERVAGVAQRLAGMSVRAGENGRLAHMPGHLMHDPAAYGSGGGGLYASAPDFLKVLTSIMRDDGKLLRSESVADMFVPQLSPASKDAWMGKLQVDVVNRIMTGGMKVGTDLSWGLGGMCSLADTEGKRKKGSLAWGGYPNLFWWIDREGGMAGLYASQVIPAGDPQSTALFAEFEAGVYQMAITEGSARDEATPSQV
ncbi:beta-lactamase/transpeptidase-like protein [Athelia psychrophila]|uniref:Beta-lactamase/transpeptidase-like protein n=1 Tax=Athelia psychrophila TaxID=1759441 RepID=A0A165X054_9AGAM|nr:beta-lactamase/transpeptidase-like protein [Fibularhizoctonia sp. CBS 109695]KZP22200.1 beta-lactamase/transpeptidase-like protein [Fibularhizoctonia sp. CBS 109695]